MSRHVYIECDGPECDNRVDVTKESRYENIAIWHPDLKDWAFPVDYTRDLAFCCPGCWNDFILASASKTGESSE